MVGARGSLALLYQVLLEMAHAWTEVRACMIPIIAFYAIPSHCFWTAQLYPGKLHDISLIMSKLTFSKRCPSALSSCAEKTFIVQNSCFSNIPFSCSSFKKALQISKTWRIPQENSQPTLQPNIFPSDHDPLIIPSFKASYVLRGGGQMAP